MCSHYFDSDIARHRTIRRMITEHELRGVYRAHGRAVTAVRHRSVNVAHTHRRSKRSAMRGLAVGSSGARFCDGHAQADGRRMPPRDHAMAASPGTATAEASCGHACRPRAAPSALPRPMRRVAPHDRATDRRQPAGALGTLGVTAGRIGCRPGRSRRGTVAWHRRAWPAVRSRTVVVRPVALETTAPSCRRFLVNDKRFDKPTHDAPWQPNDARYKAIAVTAVIVFVLMAQSDYTAYTTAISEQCMQNDDSACQLMNNAERVPIRAVTTPSATRTPRPQPTRRVVATLTPQQATVDEAPDRRMVISNGLNVRSGPGTSYAVLTTLSNADMVEVVGATEGVWIEIRTDDGTVGWVNLRYLATP
jgi:hypothetical protein